MNTLDLFLDACRAHTGDESNPLLRKATGQFLDAAEADQSIAIKAAAAMPELPPNGAAWLAVILGSHMERNGHAEDTGLAVITLLRSWLPRLVPGEEILLKAFPLICQSAVAHLAHLQNYRAELSRDKELMSELARVESLSYGAVWVRDAILRQSGPLIVLVPKSVQGLRLCYSNVWNCFHLFSLIQAAVGDRLPGGKTPDPKVADAARGLTPATGINDEAWWHYADPHSPESHIGATIWGEGHVRDIPSMNGSQVIVLWPKLLGARCWNGDFFGPQLMALPPNVIVDSVLSYADCRMWFDQLKISIPAEKKSWWSFK